MGDFETDDVAILERVANLRLNPDRRAGVVAALNAWIPAANELSRRMSDARYRGLTPSVRFMHPTEEVVE